MREEKDEDEEEKATLIILETLTWQVGNFCGQHLHTSSILVSSDRHRSHHQTAQTGSRASNWAAVEPPGRDIQPPRDQLLSGESVEMPSRWIKNTMWGPPVISWFIMFISPSN